MTNYPAQIDTSISLPSAVDNLTPVTGSVVNRLRDAILAIETELGVKPSGIYSTVRQRLDTIEGTLDGLQIISLAGDLGGTLTSPLVVGIQGRPVSTVAPSLNNVLVWSGIAWVPAAVPSSGAGGFASGDLSGNYPGPMTVVKLQNNAVKSGILGLSSDGYILTWVNSNSDWEAKPAPVGFSAGGDLTGNATSQTVIALRGKTLDSSLATVGSGQDGYILTWVNSASDWQAKPSTSGISPINATGFSPFTTANTTFTNAATFIFDPTAIPLGANESRRIRLRIVAETTGPAWTAQLYNFTAAAIVPGIILGDTNTSAQEYSTADLTGSLTNGKAIYQLQIKMAAGGGVSDQITLDFARLEVTYT